MKVFYNPATKETFELTDSRLHMYKRLLRLQYHHNIALSQVLRAFAGMEHIAKENYHIVKDLLEVGFCREVAGEQIAVNTDEAKFISFITTRESAWHGLFGGGNKTVNVALVGNIQQGELLEGTKLVVTISDIEPEKVEPSSCCIL